MLEWNNTASFRVVRAAKTAIPVIYVKFVSIFHHQLRSTNENVVKWLGKPKVIKSLV